MTKIIVKDIEINVTRKELFVFLLLLKFKFRPGYTLSNYLVKALKIC